MADEAARSRRAAFTFETFGSPESVKLGEWLAERSRFVASVPGAETSRMLVDRAFDRPGVAATWILVASNGRTVAASVELFAGFAEAQRGAIDTMARVDELELLHTEGPVASTTHGWLMQLDGQPHAMPVRWYPTARLRNKSASSAVLALRRAIISGEPATDATGWRAAAAGLAKRSGARGVATPRVAAAQASPAVDQVFDDEPIKTRGEPRPIRPIMRSHELRPAHRSLRLRREGEA
jgi:hypothetical protein